MDKNVVDMVGYKKGIQNKEKNIVVKYHGFVVGPVHKQHLGVSINKFHLSLLDFEQAYEAMCYTSVQQVVSLIYTMYGTSKVLSNPYTKEKCQIHYDQGFRCLTELKPQQHYVVWCRNIFNTGQEKKHNNRSGFWLWEDFFQVSRGGAQDVIAYKNAREDKDAYMTKNEVDLINAFGYSDGARFINYMMENYGEITRTIVKNSLITFVKENENTVDKPIKDLASYLLKDGFFR